MLLLTRAAISVFNLSVLSLLLTQQVQLGFEISASETVAVDFVSDVLWSAVISLSLLFKKEIILLAVPSLSFRENWRPFRCLQVLFRNILKIAMIGIIYSLIQIVWLFPFKTYRLTLRVPRYFDCQSAIFHHLVISMDHVVVICGSFFVDLCEDKALIVFEVNSSLPVHISLSFLWPKKHGEHLLQWQSAIYCVRD